jgi:glyoxylase-like metal-dependent hydrolase (beta-lactamase superfamily II)
MEPVVGEPFAAGNDVHVIPSYWPVPGVGVLPMNAFVIRADEPVLVDTGAGALGDDFVAALASIVRPADLRWIWLTHEDRDHTGSLLRLLGLAPRARVVSTFLAVGRILPETPFPLDRLRVVNPGDTVNVGDRNLTAVRPPLYDSPGTTGFLDDRSGIYYSSDCFGAPLPTPEEAAARDVAEVPEQTLAQGQLAWATVDSPWVTMADPDRFARTLERVRRLYPTAILSSHLPPMHRDLDRVLEALRCAPVAEPAPGTTQAELEALLAGFGPGT